MLGEKISRREFLKYFGIGAAFFTISGLIASPNTSNSSNIPSNLKDPSGRPYLTSEKNNIFERRAMRTTVWVHGNAVRANPISGGIVFDNLQLFDHDGAPRMDNINWQDVIGFSQQWGTTFYRKSNSTHWFYFPISNPVIDNGRRLSLYQVHVIYNTKPGAHIQNIDIMDGPNKIKSISCNLHEDKSSKAEDIVTEMTSGRTSCTISPATNIVLGLLISIKVAFTQDSSITFIGAGADFLEQHSQTHTVTQNI